MAIIYVMVNLVTDILYHVLDPRIRLGCRRDEDRKTSIGTVRRNTVKARLILFSVLAIALIACSFFSEYLTPHDPYLQNLDIAKQAPTKAHPLGTDRYGRDMLSRVIAGSRASIFPRFCW